MLDSWKGARERAEEYAAGRSLALFDDELGRGIQGIVVATNARSAVKALCRQEFYQRERDVYIRLQATGTEFIAGCRVPRLLDFDDELWIVEMEIVEPPFVVDFAGAYLDERPDFPPEVLEQWEAEKVEQFEDDWPWVRQILAEFAGLGIYLADVKPGNITLR